MKTRFWLVLFVIDCVVELASQFFELNVIHFVSKPLLMPLLIGFCLSMPQVKDQKLKRWIVVALFFSWVGDTLLLFQNEKSLFFILGLVAFLLAHVGYIIGFTRLKSVANTTEKVIIVLMFVFYSISLVMILWSGLGEMKLPVMVYAAVLTTMGALGVIKNTTSYPYLTLGVLFFVISDSILAINKFLVAVTYSGVLIMSTYIVAQWLIVAGLSKRMKYSEIIP